MASTASTVDDWLALADQHKAAARAIYRAPIAWNQCVFHLGLAIEALMKARIMRLERHNAWPSRSTDRDLYTHDLRKLAARAGLPTAPTHPLGPSLLIVLSWDRNQGYGHKPPPKAVIDEFLDTAFGREGVGTWLRNNLP